MNFNKTKLTLTLTLLLQLPILAQAQNKHYEAAQEAMHKQQYQKAYKQFKAAESDKKYADASLYWQSYVLFKSRQDAKARRTLNKLYEKYPNSQWLDDGKILALEHEIENSSGGLEIELENLELNEELKLFTIQQLMFKDEQKGLDMVKDLLEKTKDIKVKMNALQLMGISEKEEASKYLYEFILKEQKLDLKNQAADLKHQAIDIKRKELELKRHAIQMLSLRDGLKSNEMLVKLYKKNDNKELKSSIIQGFIHSSDHKELLKLIEKEQDNDLSQQMIQLLGVMGAGEELRKMSKTLKGEANKTALLHAFALSGDAESIKEMIDNSSSQDIKVDAIRSLIMLDDSDIGTYLLDLYKKIKVPELKQEIISVLGATGNSAKEVKQLIKLESDERLKSKLIESLMVMDDKEELLQVLASEKNTKAQRKIIQMLGVMGATDELVKLYDSSTDLAIQKQIVKAIVIDGSNKHEVFLNKAYATENPELKHSVIRAYMINDNTAALIKLLKKETDQKYKKEIIRTISMLDPEHMLNNLERAQEKSQKESKNSGEK